MAIASVPCIPAMRERRGDTGKQVLPEGIGLSEVTPVQFSGQIAFLLRNGLKHVKYAQAYSETGWFPFRFGVTNIGPVAIVDTPDVAFNPVTRRLEAAVSHRKGGGPGPTGTMKVNLYSIAPAQLAAGSTDWAFRGNADSVSGDVWQVGRLQSSRQCGRRRDRPAIPPRLGRRLYGARRPSSRSRGHWKHRPFATT